MDPIYKDSDPIYKDSKSEPDCAWLYLLKADDFDLDFGTLEVRYAALNYELDRLAVETQKGGWETPSKKIIPPGLNDWQWNAILGGDYFPAKSFLELPKKARSRVGAQFKKTILTAYEAAFSKQDKGASGRRNVGLRKAAGEVVGMAYDFQLACTNHQVGPLGCTEDPPAMADPIPGSNLCGPYVRVVVAEAGEELPSRFHDLTKEQQDALTESVCKDRRWLHAVLRSNRCRLLGRSEEALRLESVKWLEIDHQALDEHESAADFRAAAAAGLLKEGRSELLPWLVSAAVQIDLRFPKNAIMSEFEQHLEVLLAEGAQKGKPISADSRPPAYSPGHRLKQVALVRVRMALGTPASAKEWLEEHTDWDSFKEEIMRKKDSVDVLVPGTWTKAEEYIEELLEKR
jgi:hypothetical protein